MLSEKAAKKWRIVTFTLAMLGVLEYSGALNPIVYFFASEKVWDFYTGFRGDSLACYFLTALFVSETLYVLVQPKKWKRWIYSDYAGYGGFAIILFFSLYLFYAQRNSCPVQIHISWKVQLTLAVLIWFMPQKMEHHSSSESNHETAYIHWNMQNRLAWEAALII